MHLTHVAGFLGEDVRQIPPLIEFTSDTGNPRWRVVRRLAFDRTLPPAEALGRIRDALADYDAGS